MSVTTDLDLIAEAVVADLVSIGLWGSSVRQVEDPENLPPLDLPFPFALVFDLPTEYELKNSAQDWMTHQFGIAVFVHATSQHWAMFGNGQTVGRRAMQKAIRDHYRIDANKTLGGLVHWCGISRHEPGKRIAFTDGGDTDPGAIYAVSTLDIKVFQAG